MEQTTLHIFVRAGRLVAECAAGHARLCEGEPLSPAMADAINYNLVKTKTFAPRFFVLVLLLAAAQCEPHHVETRLGLRLEDGGAVRLAALQVLRCFHRNRALREDLRTHFPVALGAPGARRLLVLERRLGEAATAPEAMRWQLRLALPTGAVHIDEAAWPLLWDRLRVERLPPQALRIDLHRLPSTPPLAEGLSPGLAALERAWVDGARRVLVVSGAAGSGKSALVAGWAARLCHAAPPLIAQGWSFQPGASPFAPGLLDPLLAAALRQLDEVPEVLAPERWVPRLLERLHGQRILLVLDGLEVLLEKHGAHAGRARDERLAQLLHGLVNVSKGLCVITVRPPFTELARYVDLPTLQELTL